MIKQANLIDFILRHRALYHVLFWLLFLLLYTVIDGLASENYRESFIKYGVMLPSQILASYSISYFLVPQLLLKKKYWQFTLGFLASVYLFCAMARWSMVHLAEPFFREDFRQETILEILSDPLYLLAVYFPGIYLLVFMFISLRNVKARFEQRHEMEVLQKEKATAELKFLKGQIQPHFLFNTLNNLYALALEQSPELPDAIIKLSEILDHMLYQSAEKESLLSQEIQLLDNYIELEKLRYGEKLNIVFDRPTLDNSAKIAPLILLSFVENAFKHGVRGNKNPEVKIKLHLGEDLLKFEIWNNKPEIIDNTIQEGNNGLGASNVKRQLDLLYPQQYQLHVDDQPNSYFVSLSLPLS